MGKAKQVGIWVLTGLIAAQMAFGGIMKLSGGRQMVEGFAHFGLPDWFRIFIGAAELSAAVGVFIPRLRFWAALGLVPIMIGAVTMHLRAGDGPDHVIPAAVTLVLVSLLAYVRRPGAARLRNSAAV